MLLQPDGTLLVQMLNFVAFWLLLNAVFIVPTRRAIEARQRLIAGQQQEGDSLRAQAQAIEAQAAVTIDDARRRTDEIMRTAAAQASGHAHEIERRAAEESAATVALAHANVAAERAAAVEKQGPFIAELAQAMSQRALGVEGAA
jgi:F0F1-type ATP synthase membrane subunit b/b'